MIPFGCSRAISSAESIEPDDLGIDLALANAPRDDLGVLRTEIENENFGMFRGGFGLHVNHG